MKAPDKIYIQPNAHDGWFEGNKPNDNFVEYIRKDALLQWTKERMDINLKDADITDDRFLYGAATAFGAIIDKLNLMQYDTRRKISFFKRFDLEYDPR